MYPEFVLIQYAKTHGHRNECHEENPFHTHRSLETGGMACHARPHEKAPSLVRKQKEIERKAWAGYFIVISSGKTRQSNQV